MADETIGSVSVQITGDYSGLEKSFSESQSIAQQAGQQIGSALESGAAGADKLTSSAELADDKLQSLFASGMTLAEALSHMGSAGSEAASSIGSIGAEAPKAAAGIEDLGDKFKRVRNDAEEFEKAWGEALVENKKRTEDLQNATEKLENSIISIAAAVISFQAFKQLGEDSLMAYGRVQQLTTSLDLMGAGAVGAAEKVEELKALAVQLAVPFDELASQARKLSAVFGTGDNMFAVLKTAGDTAAGTGRSFDTVANALERIEATGTLTGRQLVTLGISWEQMAASMGVSVEEAQHRMKQGVQSASQDVADTIAALEAKFGEASERQAANVLGVWTNVKNQATFIFQTIGEQMGGLGPIFSDALKVAASGVIAFIGGIQQVTVAVIGMVRQGAEGLKGLGAVAVASMKGDFIGAAVAASDAYTKIKTAGEYTDQSLQDHAKKTAESLIAVWADSGKKISATFTPTGGGGGEGALKDTRDKVKGFSDQTGALAVLIDMEKLEIAQQREITTETAKFNEKMGTLISQEDLMAIKTALITESFNQFVKSMPDPGDTKFFSNLATEIDKSDKLVKKIGEDLGDMAKEGISGTPEEEMSNALNKLGIGFDSLTTKTRAAKTAAAEYVAANSSDMEKVSVSWENINSEVNRLAKVNLPAAISLQQEEVESAARMGAPLLQQVAIQEKLLSLQIQYRTENGLASNSQIIALANIQARTAALTAANNTLGNTYVSLMHDFQHAFDTLGGELAKGIMEGKSFASVWKASLHALETQILSTVISAIIKFGVSWVTAHVLGTAASTAHATAELAGITSVSAARAASTAAQLVQIAAVTAAQSAALATFTAAQLASFTTIKIASTALDVSEVLGDAAVGGAAAAASTAAIPIIGPALALPAGAAMYASIAGIYGPLATFSEGGMVPEDMLAMVHKGEYVLNAEKTAAAVVSGGGGGGDVHVHFNFSGAHFSNGMNDSQVKTVFDRAFRMSKLAGALPAGRFPQ